MNDKEGKMGEGKKQTGLIDMVPLKTQMCVTIILLHGQIKKQPASGNYFATTPVSL